MAKEDDDSDHIAKPRFFWIIVVAAVTTAAPLLQAVASHLLNPEPKSTLGKAETILGGVSPFVLLSVGALVSGAFVAAVAMRQMNAHYLLVKRRKALFGEREDARSAIFLRNTPLVVEVLCPGGGAMVMSNPPTIRQFRVSNCADMLYELRGAMAQPWAHAELRDVIKARFAATEQTAGAVADQITAELNVLGLLEEVAVPDWAEGYGELPTTASAFRLNQLGRDTLRIIGARLYSAHA
jgi:hypothetical protein